MALTPEEKERERQRLASEAAVSGRRSSAINPPPSFDPRMDSMVDRFAYDRNKDIEDGKARFDPLFGMNDPQMAEIIKARKAAAFGTDGMAEQLRGQGVAGINSTMATGMRGLRGMQASSGVRGGAALGQAMPILAQANQARSALESNIGIADMERRRGALDGLESTLTGERAGSLGAQFGWAGLGANDRSNALQYLTSTDFMKNAQVGAGGGGGPKPPPSQVNVGTAGNSVYAKGGGDPSSGNKTNSWTENVYEAVDKYNPLKKKKG